MSNHLYPWFISFIQWACSVLVVKVVEIKTCIHHLMVVSNVVVYLFRFCVNVKIILIWCSLMLWYIYRTPWVPWNPLNHLWTGTPSVLSMKVTTKTNKHWTPYYLTEQIELENNVFLSLMCLNLLLKLYIPWIVFYYSPVRQWEEQVMGGHGGGGWTGSQDPWPRRAHARKAVLSLP